MPTTSVRILAAVLTPTPGIEVRTAARILTEVVGKDFRDAGHLASYAGIAPVTRRSGTSIRGEHAPKGGNKRLKRALFLSAFASLNHPPSRAYYDRKRAQGKRHNQAIIALAHRRTDVLFAMLRDGTPTKTPPSLRPHHRWPWPLDGNHRGTPRAEVVPVRAVKPFEGGKDASAGGRAPR